MDKTKTEADPLRQGEDEARWYQFWEESGFFKADAKSNKKPYSLLMPPPNLTGDPHLGHAMQHAILDALARFKRMQGFDTLLLPGVDHAGIQFEGTLNKLLAKENLSKYNLSREEWLKRAWQFKDEVYKNFHQTWSIFGISADWSREVFTMEEKVQKAVVTEFQTFWDQDLLYKGAYIVQWCPKCGTAIEDLEMEYEERKEKLYYIKYLIKDLPTDQYITVATARPETIAADVAIAIYPNHPDYAKFVGKMAQNPFGAEAHIPIIEDDRVEKDFGTGALKITPGHDLLDYNIGKTHQLPILHVVGKDGKITELDPELVGLPVLEARQKAVAKLENLDLLEKAEDYTHSVPICERSKNPVEPLISEEWFVKMQPIADKAFKYFKEINFLPKNYYKILTDWVEDIHDWSISRSLWWGHRIPVWYCQKSNPHHLVGKDQDLAISLHKPEHKCQCGAKEWVQDDQVLDTWFSSGMWPMITLGWPNKSDELERYFPWDFEVTAPEIRYLWIARMILLSSWFKDSLPFKNMFFHGTLRAMDGKKMSKSLGNGVDPKDLINQWGTDATRMTLYSYAAPGRDGRLNRQIADERSKNFRNFGTKLRNIERFIVDLKPEKDSTASLHNDNPDDKKIKEELNQTITKVTNHLESFNLHLATEEIYDFVWHKFADVYIEKTKDRRAEAQPILEYVLKTSLELLHPFMPFITEELWQKLPHQGQSIMLAEWPKAE